jgi:putative ABC transport system ATP-binding protein
VGVAVEVRALAHRYETGTGALTVLDGVDLDLSAGGYLAVTGRSGAGKSTLLAVLGGLERPTSGSVHIGGVDLARVHGRALADYRRTTVGFVFQHFGLLDHLTAQENIELAATLEGVGRRARRERARHLLHAVGVGHRGGHKPLQLSGGERQRVAIARAMINGPPLLLADEPTGNLDDESGAAVIGLLEGLRRDEGCTLVVVTHDRGLAARAERHLHLVAGRAAPPVAPGRSS